MTQLSFVERLAEPVTLANAQRTAESTPETARKQLAVDLSLGRQKADAAEALFDNGHPSEAIKLARESLEHTLRAVEALAPPTALVPESVAGSVPGTEPAPEPETATAAETASVAATASATEPPSEPVWRRTLVARGLSATTLASVQVVVDAMRGSAAPRLDEDVKPEDATAFHRVLAARVAVDRAVHAAALTPAQVRAQRRNRVATLVLLAAALVVGAYFLLRTPSGTFASASEHFGDMEQYAPDHIIDGRPDTEWLLPDRANGWVEVQVGPPRRVTAVTLLNSHNPPHNDRATRDYTLEVWAHGELARTLDGTFPFSPSPEPVRLEVGVDDVERVRLVVRSTHNLGGGLAELTLE